ncbi:MAG TPA: glycosyltransferase family 9 protein [Gemmatimonadales bacterium]|nr:glycosyltransferase family 9 protein [Gemmatimonadales bacterium]
MRQRIAFVELWRIGDAVAATAGLAALAQARPDAEIAIVAHPVHGDPLFRLLPKAVHVRFPAFWTRGKLWRHKYVPWTIDYAALRHAWRDLKRFDPDVCLLFRGDVREQAFCSSVGTEIVDFPPTPLGLPWVRTVPRPRGVPRYREYVDLVRSWTGADVDAAPALRGVPSPNGHPRSYVLVHPGASWRFKQWSEGKVVAVIRELIAAGVPVKLVGGDEDRATIHRIRAELDGMVEAEFPSLPEFYALVSGARLVVCNNSAPLHIAEALGTPCVAITGPNDPVRWGTYQSHSMTVSKSVGLPCHPCAEKRCVRAAHPCIEEVQLEDVHAVLAAHGLVH